ncbi:BamA/TamA family outer membrane protein [Flexithrix dorotheae]|uniref:translocation and assembly module lipoprotein TamL n=1 Tax=Flexithrix dorotheae TaxID=70993 RepID=UPI000371B940|nr:BamA/TamA family outer membrane protein [Flexithrix dorotheae]
MLFCWSCTGTKKLQEGEFLLTKNDLKVETSEKIKNQITLEGELRAIIEPKPNFSILGMRPGIWFYNLIGNTPKKKGLKHFIKHKLGSPPVLLENADSEKVAENLKSHLINNGFFKPKVDFSISQKKKKAAITYKVGISSPYTISNIHFPKGNSPVVEMIAQSREMSLLEKGQPYNYEILEKELERISDFLREKGYFYFNPNFLMFKVDSTLGDKKVNFFLEIKPDLPENAQQAFEIADVVVYAEYYVNDEKAEFKNDTTEIGGFTYISKEGLFKPQAILDNIFIRSGSLYNRAFHRLTINKLMDLGVFNFVDVLFTPVEDKPNSLQAVIYMIPMQKKAIMVEAEMVSKSNSFAGPGFNFSWQNRNLLKGAERFDIKLNTSFETQFGVENSGINSTGVDVSTGISFPKFFIPFKIKGLEKKSSPETRVRLGYSLLNRTNLFTMNSFNATFGYSWREGLTRYHELNPISANILQLSNTTAEFDSLLQENPFLRRTYEEQYIFGTNYTFGYSNQFGRNTGTSFSFEGKIDVAGNLFYLIQSITQDFQPSLENPYTIFGLPYSQFVKLSIDPKYYFRVKEKNRLVTRLFLGYGHPYGNSLSLPYVKQFYAGGNNSIRAFRARSVGPGSYFATVEQRENLDQTGDIKIETNVEYRFDMVGILKGALFVDAGNIWLYNEDPNRPGANFRAKEFLSEFSMGAGVGFRFDFSLFILRFDFAFPLRIPYLPKEERWVIDKVNFFNSDWRNDHLVLNVAIGYPF